MATTMSSAQNNRVDVATLVKAWLILGVFDAIAAVVISVGIFHSGTAADVWRGVASAALGKSALASGWNIVALGLLFHFCVALGWTLGYYAVYSNWPLLRRSSTGLSGAFKIGIPYGALIWLAMCYIVFPLTTFTHLQKISPRFLTQLGWHMIAIGPTIVWLVKSRNAT